jgi:hypothetical protein
MAPVPALQTDTKDSKRRRTDLALADHSGWAEGQMHHIAPMS